MLYLFLAGVLAVYPGEPGDWLCPGSPVESNHWAQVEALALEDCANVRREVLARVDLQARGRWHDPHGAGIYGVLERSQPRSLLLARTDHNSNDLIGFTFTDAHSSQYGAACTIRGCSQSQLFAAVLDDSDQYCNVRMLYCGRAEGCQPVHFDLHGQEVSVQTSPGGGKDRQRCMRPSSGMFAG